MFYNMYGVENITPEELNVKIQAGSEFILLDVRTAQENAAEAIEGSYLVPIHELPHRLQELPKNKDIVVYCRIGNRSAYACVYLSRLGYAVKNLEGGIVLWNMKSSSSAARV
jgi:rhodanese-related sulfurtransferase